MIFKSYPSNQNEDLWGKKEMCPVYVSKLGSCHFNYLANQPLALFWITVQFQNGCSLCDSWIASLDSVSSNAFKAFQECFVFYMQPEVMAEDEVNNVSLCHNDNYVTISNELCSGHFVVSLFVSRLFAHCVSLTFFYLIFCLRVKSLSCF